MNNELLDKVRLFAALQIGVKKTDLKLETRIVEDLGCSGDDAVEFMTVLSKEFGVDLKGFKFQEYFDSESNDLIEPTYLLISN